MSISKLIEGLGKRIDYNRLIDECFKETEDTLMNLIRSQLAEGIKADGYMPDYKNKWYAKRKGSQRVNLKLTGDFISKLRMIQNKYSVRIRSTDKKQSVLLKMYGPTALELTPDNRARYIVYTILPLLQKKLKNELLSKN